MKVLTVRQPWAWLIVHGLKDIENRDWTTNYRGPLLIHAGQHFEKEAIAEVLSKLDAEERKRFPVDKSGFQSGGIIGMVDVVDVVTESKSRWFEGTYGWCLKNSRLLPFIPLRGSLGLFNLPPELEEQVRQAQNGAS